MCVCTCVWMGVCVHVDVCVRICVCAHGCNVHVSVQMSFSIHELK